MLCSLPLQPVVGDFGADVPFAQAARKRREHYDVELAPEDDPHHRRRECTDRFRAEMRDLVSRGLKDGFSSLLPREHART